MRHRGRVASARVGAGRSATTSEGRLMLVLRFKVQCQPDKTEQALAAFKAVIAPSREA